MSHFIKSRFPGVKPLDFAWMSLFCCRRARVFTGDHGLWRILYSQKLRQLNRSERRTRGRALCLHCFLPDLHRNHLVVFAQRRGNSHAKSGIEDRGRRNEQAPNHPLSSSANPHSSIQSADERSKP